MEANKPNVVVLPSFSEFGMVTKSERGVVPNQGALPAALNGMQSALARIGNKLGVDLNQPSSALVVSLDAALERVAAKQSRPAVPGAEVGPAGP